MAKYNSVHKSEVVGKNRLDAEFYKEEYHYLEEVLNSLNIVDLGSLANYIKKGIFDISPSKYRNNGIPLVRTTQIKSIIANEKDLVFIDEEDHNSVYKKTELTVGDILFTKIGAGIGDTSILGEKYPVYNFSQNVAGVSVKKEKINPWYLIAVLNSFFGRTQIIRYMMPSGQGKLELKDIKKIKIPRFEKYEEKIAGLVYESYTLINKANLLYSQAQELLEKELGLDKLVLQKSKSYESSFSEIVGTIRIDAEHYQTQYKQIRDNIRSYNNGHVRLLDIVQIIKPNFNPKKEPLRIFKYVELSNINSSLGVIEGGKAISGMQAPSRAKRIIDTGDIIVSSVVGSVEKSGIVSENDAGSLASTGFFHFRSKGCSAYYLLVLFKSSIFKMQLQQEATGGILSAVPDQNLKKIIVPDIPVEIQDKIVSLAMQSHQAKKESEQLLEQAKKRVEDLIEGGTRA